MRDGPFVQETLPCGLGLVCEHLPAWESIALGLWLRAGPVYESGSTSGLSHFLEHCLFKGAGKRDTRQLALEADELGGDLDGVTEREFSLLEVRVIPEHLERGVRLLCDLAFRPLLPGEEIEREKQVVLQEKAMAEDRPGDVLADLLLENVWPGNPLGFPILGKDNVVANCAPERLGAFHRQAYHPSRALLAVAGPVDVARLARLVAEAVGDPWARSEPLVAPGASCLAVGEWAKERDFEQVHVCLASECPGAAALERYPLALLDAILGGSVSSRLFQAVREERGLAYSVGSSVSLFRQKGIMLISFSTAPTLAESALESVLTEVARLREEGIQQAELERAKQQARAGLVLSMDSTTARMGRLAKNVLLLDRVLPMAEALSEVERVTAVEVSELAKTLLAPQRLALAAVGPLGGAVWDRLRLLRAAA
jgi:predicted Zn-dependent peptidase